MRSPVNTVCRAIVLAGAATLAVPGWSVPAQAQETVTVPAGTAILVRNVDPVATGSQETGAKFAAVLDAAIAVNGIVVVPAGTKVYGRVKEARAARRVRRRALLVLELAELSINDQLTPVVTDDLGLEGDPSGTVAKIGAGALVGAASGEAAGGAAVGGALALLSRGNQIHVPPSTLMEFHLTEPVALPTVVARPTAAVPAQAPEPVQQPQPQPAPQPETPAGGASAVPVGATLLVRNVDVLVTGRTAAGSRFAALLDAPLSVGSRVVAPAGAKIYGRVLESQAAGRVVRRARLVITLSEIEIAGRLYPIVTDAAGAEGGGSGTAARVGAGALIGAAAGDAGAGAAVGGAAALLTPGQQIQVPARTLMEFHLKEPLTLPD